LPPAHSANAKPTEGLLQTSKTLFGGIASFLFSVR
jgi:hypothetical protein